MELIRLAQTERGFTPITNRMLPLLVHPAARRTGRWWRLSARWPSAPASKATCASSRPSCRAPTSVTSLRRFRCPTLVLCGREDALTPLEMPIEMARLIPDARLVIIEQCGHLSTLERPHEVNAALRAWLAEQLRSRKILEGTSRLR